MSKIAVYAGTFDPITYGHLDIIERALSIFERVIVAVAQSPNKKPLFSLEERLHLINETLSDQRVSVQGFSGLLIDFVKAEKAHVVLRGLRTIIDFDYECHLASANRCLAPEIETVFLMQAGSLLHISSSFVREIASLGGDLSRFVPPLVSAALVEKFNLRG